MVWTSGVPLGKWQISNVKRRRLRLFVVWETLRRLVVECHSHLLRSHCGTSLLTLTSSTLNSISIRRRRVPRWFALMSQSISFSQPTGTFRSAARRNQTLSCYLESHRAERLIQFEHHICYSQILDVWFILQENQMGHGANMRNTRKFRESQVNVGMIMMLILRDPHVSRLDEYVPL